MASIKEIRTHIKSVEQTLKITNAMYLISSSNLRKARRQLTDVEPYFSKIEATISDILHHSPEIDHRFFDKRPGIPPDKQKTGFIVITASPSTWSFSTRPRTPTWAGPGIWPS